MDPVTAAIKYMLELSKLPAQDFRTLVENTTGERIATMSDEAWLAEELVTLCETQFDTDKTLLLSKWQEHIVTIESSAEGFDSLTQEGEALLRGFLDSPIFTFDDQYPKDDHSWSNPLHEDGLVDIDQYNADYLNNHPDLLPTFGYTLQDDGVYGPDDPTGTQASFLVRTGSTTGTVGKNALRATAKAEGINLTTMSAVYLYRLLCLARIYPDTEITVVFESNAKFWNDPLNQDVIHAFLDYFHATGEALYVPSQQVRSGSYRIGDTFILPFKSSVSATGDATPDSLLTASNTSKKGTRVLYGHGVKEIDRHKKSTQTEKSFVIEPDGTLTSKTLLEGTPGALAYITVNGIVSVENLPRKGARNYPVTTSRTLKRLSAYYGLMKSSRVLGEIPLIATAMPGIEALYANCLPVLLFSPESNLRDYGMVMDGTERVRLRNELAAQGIADELAASLRPHMDFEARNFYDFCHELEADEGCTIAEYRSKIASGDEDDPDFDEQYKSLYAALLSHIEANYTKFLTH